jgi:sugar (pentulose or hexulose) kinase
VKAAIDIGTSITKVVVYDDDLHIVATQSRPTEMSRPAPGRYEHDVNHLHANVVDLLTAAPTDGVDVVVLTGQGDGLWLLDSAAKPVRPAISWMDNRGASDCRNWSGTGAIESVYRRTGSALFPGSGAALLSATLRHDPDALAAAETATFCQHAVFQRLTGVRVASRSAAIAGLFNPRTGGYDREALAATGLSSIARLLPELADGAVAFAPIRPELVERIGLRSGALLASGPYDLPAAALGAGLSSPGDGLAIVGTTLACLVAGDSAHASGEPAGLTLCAADDAGLLRAMPAMVGTSGLDWVLSLVGGSHADLKSILRSSPPGANGVSALPYLSPAGERAPFLDSAASAEFAGLRLTTTSADLVRALCEALAYAARHCFEAAGLDGDLMLCGGASASDELMAIFADVFDRSLLVIDEPETTARGATIAASTSPTMQTSPKPASTAVFPSAESAAIYRDGYAAYLERVQIARRSRWLPRPPAASGVPLPDTFHNEERHPADRPPFAKE